MCVRESEKEGGNEVGEKGLTEMGIEEKLSQHVLIDVEFDFECQVAGKDATFDFTAQGHSGGAWQHMAKYEIGTLVESGTKPLPLYVETHVR